MEPQTTKDAQLREDMARRANQARNSPPMYSNDKMTLVKKLAKIMGEIHAVKKEGWNDKQRYNYLTEDDINREIRGRLAENKIFTFISVTDMKTTEIGKTKSGATMFRTDVKTLHEIYDGDSGAFHVCEGRGSGTDMGDKGVYKAITGACKYVWYKIFLIPTGDDPEVTSKDEEEMQGEKEGSGSDGQRQTRPQQQQPAQAQTREQDKPKPASDNDKLQLAFQVKAHFGRCEGMTLDRIKAEDRKWWEWINKSWSPVHNGKITNQNYYLYRALCRISGDLPLTSDALIKAAEQAAQAKEAESREAVEENRNAQQPVDGDGDDLPF